MSHEPQQCIRQLADKEQIQRGREMLREQEEVLEQQAGRFRLVGSETRFKILFLLLQEEKLCVCDLSDMLQMNVSAISQHLRKLKEGRFIQPERDGQTIYYSVVPEKLNFITSLFKMITLPNFAEQPTI